MIDRARLLAMDPIVAEQTLTKRDVILYALGVGAQELRFTYEENLEALPMMAAVLGYPGFIWRDPAIGADWRRLLHADQSLQLLAPLPLEGRIRGETRFLEINDKGPDKGAVARTQRRIFDSAGTLLAIAEATTFLRGDGGCGGPSGAAPTPRPIPDRPPDRVLRMATAANQALLYRLSGDYNPLHVDPDVAHAAGFNRPILHGLCTYALAGRAVLAGLLDNAPQRLRRLNVRFSAPFHPGETLEVRLWREGHDGAAFQAYAAERGVKVLDNGQAVLG